MGQVTLYDLNGIIALLTSVIIGTGAYIAFVWKEKKEKVTIPYIIAVVTINMFFTYMASEILRIWKWGEYRTLILPAIAFVGQFLMDWFNKRYLKVFDAGLRKVGLDINNNNNKEQEENYEDNSELER